MLFLVLKKKNYCTMLDLELQFLNEIVSALIRKASLVREGWKSNSLSFNISDHDFGPYLSIPRLKK